MKSKIPNFDELIDRLIEQISKRQDEQTVISNLLLYSHAFLPLMYNVW